MRRLSSDRFGRKPVITACVTGSVLGLGLFAFTGRSTGRPASLWRAAAAFNRPTDRWGERRHQPHRGAVLADITSPPPAAGPGPSG